MSAAVYQPVDSLPAGVKVCFSAASDRSLAAGGGKPPTAEQRQQSRAFLKRHGFTLPSVRLFVTYGDDHSYADVQRVDARNRGQEKMVDALYTTDSSVTLTLPVADCIATVVYDPVVNMLGVLHLGRHASVSRLIEAFAAEVAATVASRPENWHVWMSPSLQAASNRLEYFNPPHPDEWHDFIMHDYVGMLRVDIPAHNKQRFELLGVSTENIYVSPIDTYSDQRYFSHRAATEQNDPLRQGRMLVAASMVEQREAAL